MEEFRKKQGTGEDGRDVCSLSVKAGKRYYFMDIRRDRKDELYLVISESRKIVDGDGANQHVSFEKHKIFLYPEDFDRFTDCLEQAVDFIRRAKQGEGGDTADKRRPLPEDKEADKSGDTLLGRPIDIDIEF